MATRPCPNCKTQIQENTTICPMCGTQLSTFTPPAPDTFGNQPNFVKPKVKKSGNKTLYVVIGIAALVVIGIAAIAGLYMSGNSGDSTDDVEFKTSYNGVEGSSSSQYTQESNSATTPTPATTTSATVAETAQTTRIIPSSASGNFDGEGNVGYTPGKLIDGNIRTCWANDLRGKGNYYPQGFGGIKVNLNCSHLDYIVLYNGYQKNNTTYQGNPRAKTIAIYNSNDLSTPILNGTLEDTPNGQKVYALNNAANQNLSQVTIFFPGDFYYPAKWNDFSISEIEFYGAR